MTTWTQDDDIELAMLYLQHTAQEIADMLGRTKSSVKNRCQKLGLRLPESIRADRTKLGQFAQGADPWNKGRKGWKAGGRSAETRFQPGRAADEARNYRCIGSLRLLERDGYLERKVTDDPSLVPARRWVAVHRLVWEAAHGPIPDGHIVVFKPGMKTVIEDEITVDKLELITRAENMARNTVHNYPQPIPQLVQLRGAITRQIRKRERKSA